jgi:hypothetical protein
MLIKGERGHAGKGFKLQDTNNTGTYYVIVWDKNTYQKVTEWTREGKKQKSKFYGWKYLGKYEDPSTWEALGQHLLNVYGEEIALEKIQKHLYKEHERLEQERIFKLQTLHREIERLLTTKGITEYKMPRTVSAAKRHIRKLKGEV